MNLSSEIQIKYSNYIVKDTQWLPGGFQGFAEFMEEAKNNKKQLRVKLGIDPTSKELHFGHTVCLHYLRKFQEDGHIPVLIIGGFTAMVGDPSGRNEARPPLTHEQVKENAETYLQQVGKILDLNKAKIVNNYDWLSKLTAKDLLELAHLTTVNQLIGKEAFGSRISKNEPLYLHEALYPILQGYDSKEVKADIEIGGIDQTFNVLFGRHIQKHFGQKEQFVILLPLLVGLDGKKKMSKTFYNHIALNDSPDQIFGKAMSIPDELIENYLYLITNFSAHELGSFKTQLAGGQNPMNIKYKLANNLVMQLYGSDIASQAEVDFVKQFRENEIPQSVDEFKITSAVRVADLMFDAKLVPSKAEAKRLIAGGGVKLKSVKIDDPNFLITDNDKNSVLQIGKRKFLRIV